MNSAFNASFEACAEVEVPACMRCSFPGNKEQAFRHNSPNHVSDSEGSYAWLFVECYQSAGHEGSVAGPGGSRAGQPGC